MCRLPSVPRTGCGRVSTVASKAAKAVPRAIPLGGSSWAVAPRAEADQPRVAAARAVAISPRRRARVMCPLRVRWQLAAAYGGGASGATGGLDARCPRLDLVVPDPDAAAEALERILERLEGDGFAVEPIGGDGAAFDAGGTLRMHGGMGAV